MVEVDKKQSRLNGKWGNGMPFQSPDSDPNLAKLIKELELCESRHLKENLNFRCEKDCAVFESCIACYDVTAGQCRDRKLKNVEFVFCRSALHVIMNFSWKKEVGVIRK